MRTPGLTEPAQGLHSSCCQSDEETYRGYRKSSLGPLGGAGEECFLKELTLQDWVGINDKVKREGKVSTASRRNHLCKGPEAPKCTASLRSCKTRKKTQG